VIVLLVVAFPHGIVGSLLRRARRSEPA
jgi:hypothetical protein